MRARLLATGLCDLGGELIAPSPTSPPGSTVGLSTPRRRQPYPTVRKPTFPKVLAQAALLTLAGATLSSCVAYSRYEATALAMEKYKALAESRGDSIDELNWAHLQTYRENEALQHEARLRDTELHSTRTQYAQLQVANTDVVSRYDRSLALSTFENEGNFSARQRLTEAATRREGDAIRADRRVEALGELIESQESEIEELTDQLDSYRDVRARRDEEAVQRRLRTTPIAVPPPAPRPDVRYGVPSPQQIQERADRLHRLIGFEELEPLRVHGSLVSITDEGHQYVVRASESATFKNARRVGLAVTGEIIARQLASLLYGRDQLELIVHPVSKREGSATRVSNIEREQASALVDALVEQGIHPANVRAMDDAQFAGRVTRHGQLKSDSSMDGEVVFVIAARPTDGMSMR